jgi:glycosyltransferase involved in cell wall biosynthesis
VSSPVVSICIPTFNRPDYVEEAIRSCLAQTFQDFEIIVTDNSTDDLTEQRILALDEPRIRYIWHGRNIGSSANVIGNLRMASGEFIKLLMDDDVLEPECLERCVAAFRDHPQVGVVMAPLRIIDEQGRPATPTFYLVERKTELYRYRSADCLIPGRTILADFMMRKYPCCVPSGIMYRRACLAVLGMPNARYAFAGDVELSMRFSLSWDFFFIATPLSRWRYNRTSDTVNLHTRGIDVGVFYDIADDYLADPRVVELLDEPRLAQRAYLFATRRGLLGVLAGLASRNPRMIATTLATMWRRDPYKTNFLRLPFVVCRDVLRALGSWFRPSPWYD